MKIAQASMSAGLGYFHLEFVQISMRGENEKILNKLLTNLLPLEGFDHVQDILLYKFIYGFQRVGPGLGIEIQRAP